MRRTGQPERAFGVLSDARRSGARGRTAAARWRRPAATAAVLLAALAALWLAFVSTTVLGAASARADIEARLSALTGRDVFVDGGVTYDLLPRPLLVLGEVRIGDFSDGSTLSVDQLRAYLDPLDALLGRTSIARLTLLRPEFALPGADIGSPGAEPRGGPAVDAARGAYRTAIDYARSFLDRFEGVRVVQLREGTFRPGDGFGLSNIDLDLVWPARDAPAGLTGSFVWNGQPTEIDIGVERPVAFLDGAESPLELALSSPALRVGFDGAGSGGDRLGLEGTVELAAGSLPRAARWVSRTMVALPDLGAAAIEARIALSGERMTLEGVEIALGEEIGRGALEAVFPTAGRPTIAGTLAFPELDLDRFTRGVAPLPRNALDLQRPMTVSFMDTFDLDLRLSAAEAGLGEIPLRQFAATVVFDEGIAALDIGDAELFGGRAQGRLAVDLSGRRPLARGRVDLTGVDAQRLGAIAGIGSIGLAGRADLSAEFDGPATNWGDVLRENRTAIRLAVAGGSLSGVSPEVFLSPGERPLAIQPVGTPVPFDTIRAELGTRGATASLDRLVISGPQGRVTAGGALWLLEDRIDVRGVFDPVASPAGANDSFTSSQPIPFRMQGEWPVPIISVGSGTGPI